jgi:hypothetical protein
VSTRIAVTLEQLDRLRGTYGIEARFSDRHIALSVFAFGNDMIVTPHLANLVGHDSPAFHLAATRTTGCLTGSPCTSARHGTKDATSGGQHSPG